MSLVIHVYIQYDCHMYIHIMIVFEYMSRRVCILWCCWCTILLTHTITHNRVDIYVNTYDDCVSYTSTRICTLWLYLIYKSYRTHQHKPQCRHICILWLFFEVLVLSHTPSHTTGLLAKFCTGGCTWIWIYMYICMHVYAYIYVSDTYIHVHIFVFMYILLCRTSRAARLCVMVCVGVLILQKQS